MTQFGYTCILPKSFGSGGAARTEASPRLPPGTPTYSPGPWEPTVMSLLAPNGVSRPDTPDTPLLSPSNGAVAQGGVTVALASNPLNAPVKRKRDSSQSIDIPDPKRSLHDTFEKC